jgi:ADP-heptose:LPS heptosyltransferase
MEFRPTPGELFFSEDELAFAKSVGTGFVVIEPNVPGHKSVAPNKDWGAARYKWVASVLALGHHVIQMVYEAGRVCLSSAEPIKAPTFRHALAVLSRAALYIGPEGGLHHGAAAVGIPAVVLFGGFIPPQVTGYPTHTNLTGGTDACGSLNACPHCREAMAAIGVEQVLIAARHYLPER